MNDITILITTSPIPSHPKLDILEETIFGMREYTDCKIIILFDGVYESLASRTEDYEKYKWKVISNMLAGKYGDCEYMLFPHHRHQINMTRDALKKMVTTPLILFVEHDTKIINEIPFQQICELVKTSTKTNLVKFNIFEKIPSEHSYLMIGTETEMGIPLTRTIQWSQRPHIAKANWYREILFDYFDDGQIGMIEDVMHSVVIRKYSELGYDTFGLAIYTPEGNQLRSYHSDGRGADKKIIEA